MPLPNRGVITDGKLDETLKENRRNNIPESYTVTYQFTVNGKTYTGK